LKVYLKHTFPVSPLCGPYWNLVLQPNIHLYWRWFLLCCFCWV